MDGDLDQAGSIGYSGKWSDSGCILNMEQRAFAKRLDVGYETERRINNYTRNLGLRNWKDEVSIHWNGEGYGEAEICCQDQSVVWAY